MHVKIAKYLLFPVFILSLHWLAVKFYNTYCAPDNLIGYLMTYLTTANPICIYTIKIIEKTSTIYLTTWSFFSLCTVSILISSYQQIIKL
jgi:hypothetical protein